MKRGKNEGMNRRDFIKKMGLTAGAVGLSVTVPKLINPAAALTRDHILMGRPLPMTGDVSAFTESSPWLDNKALEAINKDGGIYIKEAGKKLPLRVKIVDTESNPSKAAELASMLIVRDKVDLMHVSATPATVNPVAAVCERLKVPCISTMMPNEMFLQGGPYHWSFNAGVNVRDFMVAFLQAWDQVESNKIVGLCAQNDSDGIAWAEGARGALSPRGYKLVDMGRFPMDTRDYTSQINGWKMANVEVLFANMSPPDFATLWRQCFRTGFIPKVCTAGRAGLFPSAMEAIGEDLAVGVNSELIFHPAYPYKSSLTGQTAQEFCDAYEKSAGKQWTQPIGNFHAGYEIVADVLKRARSIDRETIRKAIIDTDLDTLQGPTKFTKDNVAVTPSGCIQWVKGDKYPYKALLVANGNYKMLPIQGKMLSIPILRKKL
jgi:branched-chain amino acid transport system substrate-binding protein